MSPARPSARVLTGLLALVAAAAAACGETGAGEAGSTGSPTAERPARADADTGAAVRDSGARRRDGSTTLRIGGHVVRVEVADQEAERRQGLMGRDSLPEDHGMLFVYPEERTLSFWMRNTRIALDIAFADQRGVIVGVQRMEPQTDELHRSRQPAMYALEMEAGWFEEHGVGVGDRIEF